MDSRHPDRNAFDRFSHGEASASEERWIEDHLRSGCAVCQQVIDELLRPMLSPAFSVLLLDPPRRAPADEDVAWQGLFTRLEQRLAMVATERCEAPRLLAELLAHPPSEREALVRKCGRYQTLAVCELLIDTSFEAGFRDAVRSVELAELGVLLAGQLDAGHYGKSVVQDLLARAWAYLGNARRVAFDLAGAEEALDQAERMADRGSADPLEEAKILDFRASLLSDQGHFEQAADLLDVVIDIYQDLREPHRRGRAMISKGVFLGYAGWPEEASRQIRKGLALVEWEREPRLVLVARHNLAWFLNDCGRDEEALQQLARFRHAYRNFPDSWTELRLAWLEGRIAARQGRTGEAEEAFRGVRRRFLEEGHGYDASLVALDLANLFLQEGRRTEVRDLAAEMLSVFLSQDVHRQAAVALAVFQQAAEVDSASTSLVEEISAYLQRARRNPRLRFAKAA